MKIIGVQREQGEGAKDFAQRLIQNRPDLRAEINDITNLFMKLQYSGEATSSKQIREFRSLIIELSLKPRLYHRSRDGDKKSP